MNSRLYCRGKSYNGVWKINRVLAVAIPTLSISAHAHNTKRARKYIYVQSELNYLHARDESARIHIQLFNASLTCWSLSNKSQSFAETIFVSQGIGSDLLNCASFHVSHTSECRRISIVIVRVFPKLSVKRTLNLILFDIHLAFLICINVPTFVNINMHVCYLLATPCNMSASFCSKESILTNC